MRGGKERRPARCRDARRPPRVWANGEPAHAAKTEARNSRSKASARFASNVFGGLPTNTSHCYRARDAGQEFSRRERLREIIIGALC
jgi:hypothetical protein